MGRHKALTAVAAAAGTLLLSGCVGTSVDGGTTTTASSTTPQRSSAPSPTSSLSPTPTAPTPAPAPTASTAPEKTGSGTALAAVGTLDVKGRAPKTGYDRDLFGPPWADTDRNGCDTRNDILKRDLTGETFKAGTRGCAVLRGVLTDPYTAQRIIFVRGGASEVDIDHVVALSDAWQKGAARWAPRKRLAFANDPLNLLAVDAAANRQKGDGDAATWLPANKNYRCQYVARQVAVKAKYQAWVTAAERDAMARVLSSCPRQVLPSSNAPTTAPIAAPAPAPAPSTPTRPRCDPNYSGARVPIDSELDCAGGSGNGPAYVDGPVRVIGTDIYDLDGNSDGIGCEP